MSKKSKHKIILIGGIRYYADKPDTCRKCFFLEEPRRSAASLAGRTAIIWQSLS